MKDEKKRRGGERKGYSCRYTKTEKERERETEVRVVKCRVVRRIRRSGR